MWDFVRLRDRFGRLCRAALGARTGDGSVLSRSERLLAEHIDTRLSLMEDRVMAEIGRSLSAGQSRSDEDLRGHLAHLGERMDAHAAHQQARTDEVLQARFDHLREHFGESMHRYFSHIDQRLEDRFQFGVRPPPQIEEKRRILELADLLRPVSLVDRQKVRVGSDHDGGYILADTLAGAEALSLGIADDVSWDLAMAERGYRVHQFDHTVEAPPTAHARFDFHRRRIAKTPEPEAITISQILSTLVDGSPVILKIDIEGDEWGVFAEIDEEDLQRFDQIVCEFHGFGQVGDDAWFRRALDALRKLSRYFAVVHVHANNYGPLLVLGNVAFPDLLEVTFVNRSSYTTAESTERFPGPLDMPNKADRPDIELLDFKFATPQRFEDVRG